MLPIQMLQSSSRGPVTILLRKRATSAACTWVYPQCRRRRPIQSPTTRTSRHATVDTDTNGRRRRTGRRIARPVRA